jgi:hypothetical protein
MDTSSRVRDVVAALLVLATAFLGVVSLKEGLTSYRPAVRQHLVSAQDSDEDVVARLWEDPLSAVRSMEKEHQHDEKRHDLPAFSRRLTQRLQEYKSVHVLSIS